MYAKHSVFYDALPGYFLEFDILDRERGVFLDTPSRRKLTEKLPVTSVPVLAQGRFTKKDDLLSLLGLPGSLRPKKNGKASPGVRPEWPGSGASD